MKQLKIVDQRREMTGHDQDMVEAGVTGAMSRMGVQTGNPNINGITQ